MAALSFTYPPKALMADYGSAAAGLPCAVLVLSVPMHWAVTTGFGVLAAILLGFGVRTLLRQLSRIELSDTGIARTGPLPRRITWNELSRFRLRYFATRRDRKRGWMELTLAGPHATLSIESQIDGFETIVERAARAAAPLGIDQASVANLAALGIAVPKSAGGS